MNDIDIKHDGWWTIAQKVVATQGVGWLFLGAIMYGIYVIGPEIMRENRNVVIELSREFAQDMHNISVQQREAAVARNETLDGTLEAFRADEREDRRLFVEILKRSDLTPQELQEAIDAATPVPEVQNDGP